MPVVRSDKLHNATYNETNYKSKGKYCKQYETQFSSVIVFYCLVKHKMFVVNRKTSKSKLDSALLNIPL